MVGILPDLDLLRYSSAWTGDFLEADPLCPFVPPTAGAPDS